MDIFSVMNISRGEYFLFGNIFQGCIFFRREYFSRVNIFQGWICLGENIFHWGLFFRGECISGVNIFGKRVLCYNATSDGLRIFKGRFEEIPFTASCRADEAMQSGGDGVHPWSAWVAMACTTPGCTALDDGDDADDVHSSAAWVTSVVQKIQKLSESPATAHMVAKLT